MSDTTPTLPDPDSGPRNFITTSQDHGGIALVLCTLMCTWAVLCLLVRCYMRKTVSGPFGSDDYACVVATLFGIIQTAVSCAAIAAGFGKATDLLTASQIVDASKALYAAQLFYIITNAVTKCSVALLLARIVFIKSRVRACYAVLGLSAAWGVASFITLAIRCTGQAPWKFIGGHCPNSVAEWEGITAFDVIIEVLLFALPIWLVWGLKTDVSKKLVVVLFFSLRLPVIAAALARIYYLERAYGSPNPFLAGVAPFICLNVEMNYGLMAATWPTLRPFVGAFNTGWGTIDTQGVSGYGGSNGSYNMQSLSRRTPAGSRARPNDSNNSNTRSAVREAGPLRDNFPKNVTQVRSMPAKPGAPTRKSSGSDTSSRQMIIRQTVTCEVHYENESRRDANSSHRDADSIDFAKRV